VEKTHLINNQIKSNKIILLQEGSKPIEMNFHEAMNQARADNLDLMQVGTNEDKAICKILNYDSWLYHEKKKKEKQDFKNRSSELKGMWFRPSTGQHDFDLKIKKISEFLSDGHKVKISLKMERREATMKSLNEAVIDKIINALNEVASVDGKISWGGREATFIVKAEKKQSPAKTTKP
jgi:translation initiation factor IF-3